MSIHTVPVQTAPSKVKSTTAAVLHVQEPVKGQTQSAFLSADQAVLVLGDKLWTPRRRDVSTDAIVLNTRDKMIEE